MHRRPFFVGILLAAVTLAGCGAAVRYDPQVRLELTLKGPEAAPPHYVLAKAARDGLLWVVYRSGRRGPWAATGNALAVAKGDDVLLRQDAERVVTASAGTFSVTLDDLPMNTRTVALAYRLEGAKSAGEIAGGVGEAALTVVAVAGLVVLAGVVVVGLFVLDAYGDDGEN